jgi:two-component system, OmpR family, KDP operon response regulator KdpE
MSGSGHVLIVEDERPLRRALAMNLTARGYQVTEADTGTSALTAAASLEHDVIVLDLGLPDMSGLDVIRGVRGYASTPIVVLSARTETREKVAALDLGADDYVTKPFSIDELLARLRSATRRGGSAPEVSDVVMVGTTSVDLGAKTVTTADGEAMHLTPTEWHLLETLLRHPAKLITGRALLTQLRGTPEHTDPSYLRIYMAQLRKKLEPEPSRPRHLITEPGMGYRFQP